MLFINDIGSFSLSPRSKLILFADDILLLHPLQSSSDLSLIQSDLNSNTSWLTLNLLSVNPAKSKYMIFALKSQQCFDHLPPLQLNSLSIARVFTFRYLGILLSCNMSWASHISSISKKAKRLLGLIYRQFYKNSSTITLLSLYLTIVRPVLEYGSPIWDLPSFSLSSILESVQHFALKLASKSWSQSYDSLLSSLNICSQLNIVVRKLNSLSFTKLHIICTTLLLPSVSITFQLIPSVILPISTLLSHSVEPLAICTLSSHLPLDSGITSLPLQSTQPFSLILNSTSIVNYKSSLVYIYYHVYHYQ